MERILYFDGHCNLCNAAVDFLIRRDRHGRLKYTSLQGKTAAERLPESWRESVHTVVLQQDGQFFVESSAALRAAAALGGIYSLSVVFLIVPRFLRNAVYRFIARHRYQWFGRRETCRLPTPEERARFLP